MKSARLFAWCLAVLSLTQLDCGDDDDAPPIMQLCSKADERNRLPADVTVQVCVAGTNKCLDKLEKPDYAEWEELARECLKISDCEDFADCYRGMNPSDC